MNTHRCELLANCISGACKLPAFAKVLVGRKVGVNRAPVVKVQNLRNSFGPLKQRLPTLTHRKHHRLAMRIRICRPRLMLC